jgi:hypothetical protein
MRIRAALFAALAVFALAPGEGQAQVTLGPTVAFHEDFDFGIGAALGLPLDSFGPGFGFLADVIWFFPEFFDYLELNGNVTYDFPLEDSTIVPFVLGGLNVARASGGGTSNTELGLNLGGGIEFDAGTLRPTVGLRVELSGGEGFVIFATLPFVVGEN